MLGVLRAAQLGLRALSRAQGWDSSNPAMTESVMHALGVALGALLTTGLLSSAATHQMVLEPYARPSVALEPIPEMAQPTIASTPTIAPSRPAPPLAAPTSPPRAPVVVLDPVASVPAAPRAVPTSTEVVFATVTVNTPSILELPGAGPTGPGETLTVTGVEHGQATTVGNSALIFLPERGFIGSASVNYERCSAVQVCTPGLISLAVG